MTTTRVSPAIVALTAGVTMAAATLGAAAAGASTTSHHPTASSAWADATDAVSHLNGRDLSPTKLPLSLRARQRHLAATHEAPAFKTASSTTFTVNTTEDSSLADASGKTCVDVATGSCSLRAAVEAANNLSTPVKVNLGADTYTLTSGASLSVDDPGGVFITGRGVGNTQIAGGGSRLFNVGANSLPQQSGRLFLSSLTLTNGTADNGGAIYVDDGTDATLTMNHVAATHNIAAGAGGVVYARNQAGVYISNSSLTGNEATDGAAIFAYWSDVKITSTTIDHNSTLAGSPGFGGAIETQYGVLDVTGGSISHNTAGDDTHPGYGGAIYDSYGMTRLSDLHVDGNRAGVGGQGGAIYGFLELLQLSGGTMSDNQADGASGSGGALYLAVQNQVAVHGVTMASNSVGGPATEGVGGGAIYMEGAGERSQLVIDSGTKVTGSNNSAIYLHTSAGGIDASITGSTLASNTDDALNGLDGQSCGGAVCALADNNNGLNLEMQGDTVTANSSSGIDGSGGVGVFADSSSPVTVVLRKNVFTGNHVGASGYGGAVGLYSLNDPSSISARLASNTFTSNRAGTPTEAGYGGALSAFGYVTISDTGSTFTGNRAIGDGASGGAVLDFSQQSSTYTRSVFSKNSAGAGAPTDNGFGGAVYTSDQQGASFTQVTMSGNKAGADGGAIYGDQYAFEVRVDASTVSGNTAGSTDHEGHGGGIFAGRAALVVQNSTLAGNLATSVTGNSGQGGAIWHTGSTLGLRYSTVSRNYAEQGGGIYSVAQGGSLLSSIVSANLTSPTGTEQDCAFDAVVSRLNSVGGNVLGQPGCVRDLRDTDVVSRKPGLGTLASNGGPTMTMALTPKSLAIRRATFLIPTTDQRGQARPANHADAGAYERP